MTIPWDAKRDTLSQRSLVAGHSEQSGTILVNRAARPGHRRVSYRLPGIRLGMLSLVGAACVAVAWQILWTIRRRSPRHARHPVGDDISATGLDPTRPVRPRGHIPSPPPRDTNSVTARSAPDPVLSGKP